MAIERLKFRCYRCNQLLGATPNKAGSVVTCPKCSAELLIPVPELRPDEGTDVQARAVEPARPKIRAEARPKPELEVTAPSESAAATAVQPASRSSLAAMSIAELEAALPPDLIDLKPEDLRVEAEFFESLTRQPAVSAVREPAPWPPSEVFGPSFATGTYVSPSSAPPIIASSGTPSAPAASQLLTQTIDLSPKAPEPPTPPPVPARAETALIGTAIEIEHPSILPPGTEIRRVREVILPASVVLSWSLFVLLGIALSFVAGLLMGHFLWTTR
jgi:DNA-directed RNA polymerase subunit RPC12/RpoP